MSTGTYANACCKKQQKVDHHFPIHEKWMQNYHPSQLLQLQIPNQHHLQPMNKNQKPMFHSPHYTPTYYSKWIINMVRSHVTLARKNVLIDPPKLEQSTILTKMQLDMCIKINTKCKLRLRPYDILKGSNLNSCEASHVFGSCKS